jgi:hypothetical protein
MYERVLEMLQTLAETWASRYHEAQRQIKLKSVFSALDISNEGSLHQDTLLQLGHRESLGEPPI